MIHHSLSLIDLLLPDHPPGWPRPLNLEVGLKEMVLLEGVPAEDADRLLRVLATLKPPAGGALRHWGMDAGALPRAELFHLRSRIAYISPRQTLLYRLTMAQNLAVGACYQRGCDLDQALAELSPLLHLLELAPVLSRYPRLVSREMRHRAVWARELGKNPEMILAALTVESDHTPASDPLHLVLPWLEEYLAQRRGAALLVGRSLSALHHLARRRLTLDRGRLREAPLPDRPDGPLAAFFPLW